jgi:hypothetical protein
MKMNGIARALAWVALVTTAGACESRRSPDPAVHDAVADTTATRPPATSDSPAAAPSQSVPEPDARPITPDGWGPLRIGMTRAEVAAAAGEDANPDAVGGPDPEQCDEFRPRNAPPGVLVMIERGVLTRISVSRSSDILTAEGFGVGDRSADVASAYGSRARIEAHEYQEPPATYITIWRPGASGTDRRGIRYEGDASGAIVHVRAGGPSIEYTEGCV